MAAPPTADQLAQLTLDELIAMRQLPEYADVAATPAYQQALAAAKQSGQQSAPGYAPQREAVASAATKLGVPTPAAVMAGQAKATEVKAQAKQIITDIQGGKQVTGTKDAAVNAEVKRQGAASGNPDLAGLTAQFGNSFPAWIASTIPDIYNQSTNTTLYDKKQQKKVVAEYNKLVTPDQQVSTWDQFLAKNPEPNEEAKSAITFAGLAKAGKSHTFSLPNGQKYTIDQADLQGLSEGTVFGPEQMSHVQDALNLAAQYNVRHQGPTGDLAWQPLFALQRLHKLSFEPLPATATKVAQNPRGPTSAKAKGVKEPDNTVAALGKAVAGFARKQNQTSIALTFQRNLAEIGDPTLALIKTADPDTYSHVFRNGKVDPDSLAAAAAANQILVTAGWGQMSKISYGVDDDIMRKLSTFNEINSSGGGGSSITLPDPVKIEQTMKDLYNGWFGLDPTGNEYETFKNDLYGKLRGTLPAKGQKINNDIDPGAQLRQFAEQSPQYAALFGQKPTGVTADDYVNSQRQAVGSILGNDLSPEAVRAGQLTGHTQSAIGAAATSEQAKTNSNFMERLARAAQVVSANT